jgi:leader peptidase (prepilin peptidase)/N-methyltransferase
VWYNSLQPEPVGYRVSVLCALAGLLVGAFLNLAADHLPLRRSVLSPPHCFSCKTPWSWREAIPLLGLVSVRGRCPRCGAPFSWRRPLLELTTALSFGFFWLKYGASVEFILVALYASALFLLFVIDLEHRLILRVVIFPAIALAIVGSHFYPGLGLRRALLGGGLAFVFFYFVVVVGKLAFGRTAMGRGDANLAGFVGLITGFPEVILALVITVCLGGLVSLALVAGGTKQLRSYIPYGVFLVVGGLSVLIFGREIIAWYFGLF